MPEEINTIKQLKEMIKDLPDKTIIMLEGCDCVGDWNGKITESDGEILLGRD